MFASNFKLLLAFLAAASVLAAPAPCDDHSHSASVKPTPTTTWTRSHHSHWHSKSTWSAKTVTATATVTDTDTTTVTNTNTDIVTTTSTDTFVWSSSAPAWTPTPTTTAAASSIPAWTSTWSATPSATPSAGPGSGSCSSGPVQCCNSVQNASSLSPEQNATMHNSFDQATLSRHGLFGLPIGSGLNVPIGANCSPVDLLGVGGTSCASTAVCCSDVSQDGLVNIGCVPAPLQL